MLMAHSSGFIPHRINRGILGTALYLHSGQFSRKESATFGWNIDSVGRVYGTSDGGLCPLGYRIDRCCIDVHFPEKGYAV